MAAKSVERAAYGDFQTPPSLAERVCRRLYEHGARPAAIIEPTCGQGNFLLAASEIFAGSQRLGLEVDRSRVERARQALHGCEDTTVEHADFFAVDWEARLAALPGPRLVLGNPPWVTSAQLGALQVANLPEKSNAAGLRGLAAKMGKANFDISEWMVRRLLEAGQSHPLRLAMLIKTAVARRVLVHAQRHGLRLRDVWLRRIDARRDFGATVDAALLHCRTDAEPLAADALRCSVFESLDAAAPECILGFRDGTLVADLDAYARGRVALGEAPMPWRSGIKHDCARVMELRRSDEGLQNGLGQRVDVEPAAVFGLLKSADLRGQPCPAVRRWLLLVQQRFGQDPAERADELPQAWAYLQSHAADLDARRSSIYRTQPRFAVFGLGPYSFAPWKVAISGLRKHARFTLVGPDEHGRPIVLDDTCYFIGFDTEAAAARALGALRSAPVQALRRAFEFDDAKRPITKDLLDRLDWGAGLPDHPRAD